MISGKKYSYKYIYISMSPKNFIILILISISLFLILRSSTNLIKSISNLFKKPPDKSSDKPPIKGCQKSKFGCCPDKNTYCIDLECSNCLLDSTPELGTIQTDTLFDKYKHEYKTDETKFITNEKNIKNLEENIYVLDLKRKQIESDIDKLETQSNYSNNRNSQTRINEIIQSKKLDLVDIKRKIQRHSKTIETEQTFLAKNAKKLAQSKNIFNERLNDILNKFETTNNNVNQTTLIEVEKEKREAQDKSQEDTARREEIELNPNIDEKELEKAVEKEIISQDKVKELANKYNWVLKKINSNTGTELKGNTATVICDDINSYVGTGNDGCFKQCSDEFKSTNNEQFFECNTRRSSNDVPTGKM